MKKSMALALMMVAGAATSVALGSEADALPFAGKLQKAHVGNAPTNRAILPHFNVAGADGELISTRLVLNTAYIEDASFIQSLWEGVTGRVISQIVGVAWRESNAERDLVYRFWDEDDHDWAGPLGGDGVDPQITAGATPLGTVRLRNLIADVWDAGGFGGGPGDVVGLILTLDLLPGDPDFPTIAVPDDDDGVVVEVLFTVPGGTVGAPWAYCGTCLPVENDGGTFTNPGWAFGGGTATADPADHAQPGFTDNHLARDQCPGQSGFTCPEGAGGDGVLTQYDVPGVAPIEQRINQTYAIGFTLAGDIDCPSPPNITDLTVAHSCLDLGDEVIPEQTGDVDIGAADTYQFCSSSTAVSDANQTYLDIDTDGSAGDVVIGMYDSNGILLALDDGQGDGDDDQLSFGLGRRNSGGDGLQFDGRDGELTAAGNFFVVVAPAGTTMANCFGITFPPSSDRAPQAYKLHIASNLLNFDLPASVPPIPTYDVSLAIGSALVPCTATDTPTFRTSYDGEVFWIKFDLPGPVTALNGAYLDLETTRHSIDQTLGSSSLAEGADPEMVLFTNTGAVLDGDDVDGPGEGFGNAPNNYDMSSLSYGDDGVTSGSSFNRNYWDPSLLTNSATTSPPPNGRDGELTAGTYWLALDTWGQFSTPNGSNDPVNATIGRWHFRALSQASQPLALDMYYSDGSCAHICDAPDFNGDGTWPDAVDLFDFINTFSGGGCNDLTAATNICGDMDFNNDAIPSDTIGDLFGFIDVFGGAPCP